MSTLAGMAGIVNSKELVMVVGLKGGEWECAVRTLVIEKH